VAFSIPLPYLVISYLPVLSSLRAPARFVVVVDLALAVLAALSLTAMTRGRRRRSLLLVAALAFVAVDFLPSTPPVLSKAVPPAYQAIATAPDDLAVLEIPLQWSTGSTVVGDLTREDSVLLYDASVYGHPVVNGSVARYPPDRLNELMVEPVYRKVLELQHDPGFVGAPDFTAAALRGLGIGYVVYHRDRPEPDALDYLTGLDLPVLADDGTVIVWAVPA
jgi:hypothetical protein